MSKLIQMFRKYGLKGSLVRLYRKWHSNLLELEYQKDSSPIGNILTDYTFVRATSSELDQIVLNYPTEVKPQK